LTSACPSARREAEAEYAKSIFGFGLTLADERLFFGTKSPHNPKEQE
jgi:hypothetical protein